MAVNQKVDLVLDPKYKNLVIYTLDDVRAGLLGDLSVIESERSFQFDHRISNFLWRFTVRDKKVEIPTKFDGAEIIAFNQARNAEELLFEHSEAQDILLRSSEKSRVIFVYMYPAVRKWNSFTEVKIKDKVKDVLQVVAKASKAENLFRRGNDLLVKKAIESSRTRLLSEVDKFFDVHMKQIAKSLKGSVNCDETYFCIRQIEDLPYREENHLYDLYIYLIDKENEWWWDQKKNLDKAVKYALAPRVFLVIRGKELYSAGDIMYDLDTITKALKPLELREKGQHCFTCIVYPDFCSVSEFYSKMGVEVRGPSIKDHAPAVALASETGLLNLTDSVGSTANKGSDLLNLNDSIDSTDSKGPDSCREFLASVSVSKSVKFDWREGVLFKPSDYVDVPWAEILHPIPTSMKSESFNAKLRKLATLVADDGMRNILLKDATTVEVSCSTRTLRLMNKVELSRLAGWSLTLCKRVVVDEGFEVRTLNDDGIRVIKCLIRWMNGNFRKFCVTPDLAKGELNSIHIEVDEIFVDLPCELVAGESLSDVESFKQRFQRDIESLISVIWKICSVLSSKKKIPPMLFHLFEIMRNFDSWIDNYDYILNHPSLWTHAELNDFCQWSKRYLMQNKSARNDVGRILNTLNYVQHDWISYVRSALPKYYNSEHFKDVLDYSLQLRSNVNDSKTDPYKELIGPLFWTRELFSHARRDGLYMSFNEVANGVLLLFPVYFCQVSWALFSTGHTKWFQP